jgi:hypothetical protein
VLSLGTHRAVSKRQKHLGNNEKRPAAVSRAKVNYLICDDVLYNCSPLCVRLETMAIFQPNCIMCLDFYFTRHCDSAKLQSSWTRNSTKNTIWLNCSLQVQAFHSDDLRIRFWQWENLFVFCMINGANETCNFLKSCVFKWNLMKLFTDLEIYSLMNGCSQHQ